MKSVLLIPAYNPSGVLLNLVESLIDKFTKIIIIDQAFNMYTCSIVNETSYQWNPSLDKEIDFDSGYYVKIIG